MGVHLRHLFQVFGENDDEKATRQLDRMESDQVSH